ncbi:MAG: alanine racemase [Anaerolineaceae bacterium]|nr:alanine racemase [Anaerolineaceae bacterium]
MTIDQYPTWVEINLSAVESNVKRTIERAGVPLMAVVKDNAYGHGSVEVAKVAVAAGVTYLSVSRFSETRILRQAGIQVPILSLGMVTPAEVDEAIVSNVIVNLHSFEVAEMFAQRARAIGKPVTVHLKVDTGMGRLGVQVNEIVALARYALAQGNIQIDGMFSHFANADLVEDSLTPIQVIRFQQAVDALHEDGIYPRWLHLSNTAGTLVHPEARFTMTRAGSAVVGIWPFNYDLPYPEYLRPALTWKARLASCKILPAGWAIGYGQIYPLTQDELIGVIPVGYGDGFRRTAGNEVIIGGQKVPVRGRLCMDQTMIHLPKKYPFGEEVVLIGKQGDARIRLEDLALRYDTSQVDVSTGINIRVPRIYVRD